MLFCGGFLRKRPRQHEFGLKYGASDLNFSVQGRRHPSLYGMENPSLHVCDRLSGIPFVPSSVEIFGDVAELDDEVTRRVLRLRFAALFAPKAEQGGFISTHDDPRVRAAYKGTAVNIFVKN